MTTSEAPDPGKKRVPRPAKTDQFGMTPANWVRLRAKTDDEIMAAALADPDARPLSNEKLGRMRRVAFAKFTRQRLGLSQAAFARAFGIPLGTSRTERRAPISKSSPASPKPCAALWPRRGVPRVQCHGVRFDPEEFRRDLVRLATESE
jgi:DNA-binding transcriptional regulator YiaG